MAVLIPKCSVFKTTHPDVLPVGSQTAELKWIVRKPKISKQTIRHLTYFAGDNDDLFAFNQCKKQAYWNEH